MEKFRNNSGVAFALGFVVGHKASPIMVHVCYLLVIVGLVAAHYFIF